MVGFYVYCDFEVNAMREEPLKKFEVWTEGYRATGDISGANFHGIYEGETFRDAVSKFADSLTDPRSIACINLDVPSFWGCKFYDNEKDARRYFG
jgi:hypothetical protein